MTKALFWLFLTIIAVMASFGSAMYIGYHNSTILSCGYFLLALTFFSIANLFAYFLKQALKNVRDKSTALCVIKIVLFDVLAAIIILFYIAYDESLKPFINYLWKKL